MASKKENSLTSYLEVWFMKLPPLSRDVRVRLAGIAPILSLVFGILGIIGSIGVGVVTPLMLVFGGPNVVFSGVVTGILGLVSSILVLCSYPGLKAYAVKGWNLLFWSQILSIVASVVHPSSLLSGILVGLLGLYLLFQIKSLYK